MPTDVSAEESKACPCGSSKAYVQCCGRLIESQHACASTPEALMRSRYTAYVLNRIDYIQSTMVGRALAAFSYEAAVEWSESAQWLGLEVVSAPLPTRSDEEAIVQFVVHYRLSGLMKRLEETSRFVRGEAGWAYEGQVCFRVIDAAVSVRVGRNDSCPCGSGNKYKKCCLGKGK